MVGHLKFRVFPPFPLQPFIADRLRSITRLEKGNDSYMLLYIAGNNTVPQLKPTVIPVVELILLVAWFTFVRLTLGILDVRIVPFISPDNEMLR